MADISVLKTPNGNRYAFKDIQGRADALEFAKLAYIQELKDLCLFAEIANADNSGGGEQTINAQAKTVIPKTTQQIVRPDDGYNYLTQVTVKAVPYTEEASGDGTTVFIAGEE